LTHICLQRVEANRSRSRLLQRDDDSVRGDLAGLTRHRVGRDEVRGADHESVLDEVGEQYETALAAGRCFLGCFSFLAFLALIGSALIRLACVLGSAGSGFCGFTCLRPSLGPRGAYAIERKHKRTNASQGQDEPRQIALFYRSISPNTMSIEPNTAD